MNRTPTAHVITTAPRACAVSASAALCSVVDAIAITGAEAKPAVPSYEATGGSARPACSVFLPP